MFHFSFFHLAVVLTLGFAFSCPSNAESCRAKSKNSLRMSTGQPSCSGPNASRCNEQDTFCFDKVCLHKPARMFCYTEHCMVECNDGYIDRELCTPCEKQCDTICADHGGCKGTCERAEGRVFDTECPAL